MRFVAEFAVTFSADPEEDLFAPAREALREGLERAPRGSIRVEPLATDAPVDAPPQRPAGLLFVLPFAETALGPRGTARKAVASPVAFPPLGTAVAILEDWAAAFVQDLVFSTTGDPHQVDLRPYICDGAAATLAADLRSDGWTVEEPESW